MIYITLFWEFFKTGLFSIGGGLATLPFLHKMGEKFGWFSAAELADMMAVSESTPGPFGVNMATYAGYNTGGLLGSIIATAGLVFPSVLVVLMVAKFLDKFSENKYVKSAFYGLRPAVTALIAAAGFGVFKITILTLDRFELSKKIVDLLNIKNAIIFILIFFLIKKFNKHPIVYIILGAVLGMLLKL